MSTLQTAILPPSDQQTALSDALMSEAHAHRLYLHAARQMEAAGLYVITHALRFTAAQEKEHTDILRGWCASLEVAPAPPAKEPPLLPQEPLALLHAAADMERDAAAHAYPRLTRIALAEGLPRLAEICRRIGETELCHAQRFERYAQALSDKRLFRDDKQVSWVCLSCGQYHTGQDAPPLCPGCGRAQGQFIRSSFWPFSS